MPWCASGRSETGVDGPDSTVCCGSTRGKEAGTLVEGDTDSLLGTLLDTVINALGAQSGYLITGDSADSALRVRAARNSDDEHSRIVDLLPVEQYPNIGLDIVRDVIGSGEGVVLDNAGSDERYGQTAGIQERPVRSVVCVPVLRGSDFRGVLYMENNLLYGIFSLGKLEAFRDYLTEIAAAL